jgi:hypothetical protein
VPSVKDNSPEIEQDFSIPYPLKENLIILKKHEGTSPQSLMGEGFAGAGQGRVLLKGGTPCWV